MPDRDPLYDACHEYFKAHADAREIVASKHPDWRAVFEVGDQDAIDDLFEDLFPEDARVEDPDLLARRNRGTGMFRAPYDRLKETIDLLAHSKVEGQWQWQWSEISLHCGDVIWHQAREVWRATAALDEAVRRAAWRASDDIKDYLDNIERTEWIACVPLERRFEGFPEFTDFGSFKVVNARTGTPGLHRNIFSDFIRILGNELEVEFHPPSEVDGHSLLDSDFQRRVQAETQGYIPGRPQLVIRLETGEWDVACERLRWRLNYQLPLLRLCQLACDVFDRVRIGTRPPMTPDLRREMAAGLIEIPCTALAIDKRTGAAQTWSDLWTLRHEYEMTERDPDDPQDLLDLL